MEKALTQFVLDIFKEKELSQTTKLFFIPIGLPGTGKSTLAKHLESVSHQIFDNYHSQPSAVSFKQITYD
jgi:hypothetical protein